MFTMTDFIKNGLSNAVHTALQDNYLTPKTLIIYREFPALSDIIQALENFQDFEPSIRTAAIALHASELSVCQLHFYVIALHAGLGGWR